MSNLVNSDSNNSKSINDVTIGFNVLSYYDDRSCKVTIHIDDRRKTVLGSMSRLMKYELDNNVLFTTNFKYSSVILSDDYTVNPFSVIVYEVDGVKRYHFMLVKERSPKKIVDVCPISGDGIVTYVNRYWKKSQYKRLHNKRIA